VIGARRTGVPGTDERERDRGYHAAVNTSHLLVLAAAVLVGILLMAGFLHLLGVLGAPGRAVARWATAAPGLDLVVAYFIAGPWLAATVCAVVWKLTIPAFAGTLLVTIAAQIAALLIWIGLHELACRGQVRGPRVVTTLNGIVGPFRNLFAVWWTGLAVPLFLLVRLAEWVVYPPLVWLVRFPRYNQAQWVNVSRQKFDGLVGYDRIWCLYCDWMTGVWSLGGEMLRNVESFWCPIRFGSPEKCENCRHDFPDVVGEWIPADRDLSDVTALLKRKYTKDGPNTWFGHPVRLTVEGEARWEGEGGG